MTQGAFRIRYVWLNSCDNQSALALIPRDAPDCAPTCLQPFVYDISGRSSAGWVREVETSKAITLSEHPHLPNHRHRNYCPNVENWGGGRKDKIHRANKWQFSINNQGVNLNNVFDALSVFFPSGLRLEMQIDNPAFFIAQLSCAMKVDFSDAHLTIVVVPIDLRVGFLLLATIAECQLGIPVTKGNHYVWPSSASIVRSVR